MAAKLRKFCALHRVDFSLYYVQENAWDTVVFLVECTGAAVDRGLI